MGAKLVLKIFVNQLFTFYFQQIGGIVAHVLKTVG